MFREPFFSIIDVYEPRGRSMADIVKEEAENMGLSLEQLRSWSQKARPARGAIIRAIRKERPDLTSGQVAAFFRRDSSTIRHYWRQAA